MPRSVPGELDKMPNYVRDEIWTDGTHGETTYKDFVDAGTFPIEQGSWQNTSAFSESSLKKIIAYNHALMNLIDDCVGKVLAALDEHRLTEDTIIVFTSDHGEFMGRSRPYSKRSDAIPRTPADSAADLRPGNS